MHCSTTVTRSKHCILVSEGEPRKQVLNAHEQLLLCAMSCNTHYWIIPMQPHRKSICDLILENRPY